MLKIFKKIRKFPQTVKNNLQRADNCQSLHDYFTRRAYPSKNTGCVITVQGVDDIYYFALFGFIAQSLQDKKPELEIEYYLPRALDVGEFNSRALFFPVRMLYNTLANLKWSKLYSSYCNRCAFSSNRVTPISDACDFLMACNIFKSLTSNEDVVKLRINNLLVGDLIYDSYLRFKPAPSVDVNDKYLRIIIWQALRNIRRARKYFSKTKPFLYLTSYSTYIQHGIAARVAIEQNVIVLAFGNLQEMYKILSAEDIYHTKNTYSYASDFNALPNQDMKLADAEKALQVRLGGGIDAATSYMRTSAYSQTVCDIPDVAGRVIIFLHDFFDSPHVYADMVFPDFWMWICFTIDTLTEHGIPFAIKPHPNQIALSDTALKSLIDRYPNMMVLNTKITNKQLVAGGMVCAITVYGTIGHEMAFMGIPTISSARHPHHSFDFCYNADNIAEYSQLLSQATQLHFDVVTMRNQSLAFYYMHNLGSSDEHKQLMTLLNEARFGSDTPNFDMLGKMKMIKELKAYKCQIDNMNNLISK